MNPLPNRIVIYARDIMNITGRRERTAHKLLTAIRKKCNKPKGAFVTIEEFCQYTGINPDLIRPFLR